MAIIRFHGLMRAGSPGRRSGNTVELPITFDSAELQRRLRLYVAGVHDRHMAGLPIGNRNDRAAALDVVADLMARDVATHQLERVRNHLMTEISKPAEPSIARPAPSKVTRPPAPQITKPA